MPSKKQRRRQQKLKRHEYEEVYVDEEGRELAPEEAEELVGPAKSKSSRETRAKAQPQQRGGRRAIEPPSLRRTAKRGLLFFPLMLLVIFLLPAGEDATTLSKVINALVLMAFFLPFSYFMDSMMWRTYQRRQAKELEPKKR
jgi:cation transport ATPase